MHKKKVVLGVTGSIAIYKVYDLIRVLQKNNILVEVILSKMAEKIAGKVLFMALADRVYVESDHLLGYTHLDTLRDADLFCVVPATANTIAKMSVGIADTLLLSSFLGIDPKKVHIFPAMNSRMYAHPSAIKARRKLEEMGVEVHHTENGDLACGDIGDGRLMNSGEIFDEILSALTKKDLKNKRILITAGATRESLDPVRFLSNHSTGKMGVKIAQSARRRGADVRLIVGQSSCDIPVSIPMTRVKTAVEMRDEVLKHIDEADVFISTAAVSDFRPKNFSSKKIKKEDEYILELKKTPDILKEVASHKKSNQICIGFALETNDGEKNAMKKLQEKHLDSIVLNSPDTFGSNRIHAIIFSTNEDKKEFHQLKDEFAQTLLDHVRDIENAKNALG